jgi:4-hydroxybenzoate polyprenyltransferase
MALNDIFDRDLDAVERPERPIPSGRIALPAAKRVGWGLLAAGLFCAAVAAAIAGVTRPIMVAAPLAALVVGYDAFLKRTPLGPLAMGGCRALNVLLGMSAAPLDGWHAMHLVIAAGLGVYVAGLTWFARNEASTSRRPQLALAALVMLGGIAMLMEYPGWFDDRLPEQLAPRYAVNEVWRWNALWLAIGALVGHRLLRAIVAPTPASVQLAVKSSILSIVVLDAICCLGVRGPLPALTILLMLPPAMWLGRWIYST